MKKNNELTGEEITEENLEEVKLEELSMEDLIGRINNFTKISRERPLTEEEKSDREKHRKIYMIRFKKQVIGHLEKITIVDEDGTIVN
ncbi:DUF896 domain-containing protein [Fusobacterium sp. PH5-44]|uniref:DUF896 domain-containing protein n=1 Tax=unclassified Fusobacterium TaxID=2648384 RepID=UPI003D1C0408